MLGSNPGLWIKRLPLSHLFHQCKQNYYNCEISFNNDLMHGNFKPKFTRHRYTHILGNALNTYFTTVTDPHLRKISDVIQR